MWKGLNSRTTSATSPRTSRHLCKQREPQEIKPPGPEWDGQAETYLDGKCRQVSPTSVCHHHHHVSVHPNRSNLGLGFFFPACLYGWFFLGAECSRLQFAQENRVKQSFAHRWAARDGGLQAGFGRGLQRDPLRFLQTPSGFRLPFRGRRISTK